MIAATTAKPYLSGVVEGLRLEPVPGCGLLQITNNKTYNLSRRDDLISFGYSMIYLYK